MLIVKDPEAGVGGAEGLLRQVPWNRPEEVSASEEVTAAVSPDLSAALKVRVSARGDYAVHTRQAFEIDEERKTRLERVYGRRFAGASVKEESFSRLRDLDEPVAFSVALDVPRFVAEAPEGLVIRAPEDFFSTGESLKAIAALEERRRDVLLGSPRRAFLRTVYQLPPALKVKSLPAAHDVKTRFGRLQVTYAEEGPQKLVSERLIEVTAHRVSVADYAELRDFAASVDRLADEKIVLERVKEEGTGS